MKPTMAARIRVLQEMTVPELRVKYREVFEEEPRSQHKENLWKAIAWRLQATEEGDLSERARRRAAEIANDADVRVRAPKNAFGDGAAPAAGRTRVDSFQKTHDARLPMAGTEITREYRGRLIRVTVLDHGFEHDGKVYRSLTALVREVTGSHLALKPELALPRGIGDGRPPSVDVLSLDEDQPLADEPEVDLGPDRRVASRVQPVPVQMCRGRPLIAASPVTAALDPPLTQGSSG